MRTFKDEFLSSENLASYLEATKNFASYMEAKETRVIPPFVIVSRGEL